MILRSLALAVCATTLLVAKGPPNDNFSRAKKLSGKLPIKVKGSLTDKLDRFRATREEGEPNHAGRPGKGSVWYRWTAKEDRRVIGWVATRNMDILLAAYTGSSVDNLTLVHQFEEFASPCFSRRLTEPFTTNARVEFSAKAGRTYYFVVDTENEVFEDFQFIIGNGANLFTPRAELLKPGSSWSYLLARNSKGEPVDPASLDPDFYYTWMFPNRYDGPDFSKGRTPIGFGKLPRCPVRTNLMGTRDALPPSGKRYTAYLRTSFTPFDHVSALGLEGIFDDGCIFYINGREATRINVAPDKNPQDWKTLAKSAKIGRAATEHKLHYITIDDLDLPADMPVNIGISLHNASPKSDDIGFDLRIYSVTSKGRR